MQVSVFICQVSAFRSLAPGYCQQPEAKILTFER
jgi:hypothetical protein